MVFPWVFGCFLGFLRWAKPGMVFKGFWNALGALGRLFLQEEDGEVQESASEGPGPPLMIHVTCLEPNP